MVNTEFVSCFGWGGTLWKITIFHGKIHYKWSFSIAMLNYQRVTEDQFSAGISRSQLLARAGFIEAGFQWLRSPPSFQSQRSQRNAFSATCGFELRDHLCKEMNLVSFILFVCSRNFACFSTCWGRLRKLFQIDHQPVVHFSLPSGELT